MQHWQSPIGSSNPTHFCPLITLFFPFLFLNSQVFLYSTIRIHLSATSPFRRNPLFLCKLFRIERIHKLRTHLAFHRSCLTALAISIYDRVSCRGYSFLWFRLLEHFRIFTSITDYFGRCSSVLKPLANLSCSKKVRFCYRLKCEAVFIPFN